MIICRSFWKLVWAFLLLGLTIAACSSPEEDQMEESELLNAVAATEAENGNLKLGPDESGMCPFDETDVEGLELTDQVIADMLYCREEEKLAHDVYVALNAVWSFRPFANIQEAELVHMAAMKRLLDLFELEDPVLETGVFSNSKIQGIYDSLVNAGSQSLEDAIMAGAFIEEHDIWDLKVKIETLNGEYEPIMVVYANLLKGSSHHLQAFGKHLLKRDIDYVPKYLEVDEFWDIVENGLDLSDYNIQCNHSKGKGKYCPNPDCPNPDCPNPDCPNPDCPNPDCPNPDCPNS